MSRKRVHVLFTGGTISMRIDPGTGAAVPAPPGGDRVAGQRPGAARRGSRSRTTPGLPGPM